MLKQNMGRLDRTLRFVVGVALVATGLFALDGTRGNVIGVLGLTGFCPLYLPFGISTTGRSRIERMRS